MEKSSYYIPYVIEQTSRGERSYDIYSRLLKDRIVLLSCPIDDNVASSLVAQLLFLQAEDSKQEIKMFINSPGGSVTAGLAIYDTMNMLSCDIQTTCVGQAASMGAFLLSAGTKNKRYSLPNSRIMIHQPWGGVYGTAADITIQAKEIKRLKTVLTKALAKNTGKTFKEIEVDTDRDFFMDATSALKYGLIDKVIT